MNVTVMTHAGPLMSHQDTGGLGIAMKIAMAIGDPTHDRGQDGLDVALTDIAQQREAMDPDPRKGYGKVGQDG
jgi:hypothetical protein